MEAEEREVMPNYSNVPNLNTPIYVPNRTLKKRSPSMAKTKMVQVREPVMSMSKKHQIGPVMIKQEIWGAKDIRPIDGASVTVEAEQRVVLVGFDENASRCEATLVEANGKLLCQYCSSSQRTAWCIHLRTAISAHADVALYSVPVGEMKFFLVPIIPSEGVFVGMVLNRIEEDYVQVLTTSTKSPSDQVTIGVGYAPALGTMELKGMFVDWFTEARLDPAQFNTTYSDPEQESRMDSTNAVFSNFTREFFLATSAKSLANWLTSPNATDLPKI